jgi:hypothetical protein
MNINQEGYMITKLNKENINEIKIALDKIARETGEDEDPNIQNLIFFGVTITKEEIVNFGCHHRFFFIVEPFQEQKYEELRKELENGLPYPKPEDLISVIWENGKKFMKYPYKVKDYEISDNIYDDLEAEHQIDCTNYTENAWEEIKKLESWKKCERQVAREIIALEICNHLKIST